MYEIERTSDAIRNIDPETGPRDPEWAKFRPEWYRETVRAVRTVRSEIDRGRSEIRGWSDGTIRSDRFAYRTISE